MTSLPHATLLLSVLLVPPWSHDIHTAYRTGHSQSGQPSQPALTATQPGLGRDGRHHGSIAACTASYCLGTRPKRALVERSERHRTDVPCLWEPKSFRETW